MDIIKSFGSIFSSTLSKHHTVVRKRRHSTMEPTHPRQQHPPQCPFQYQQPYPYPQSHQVEHVGLHCFPTAHAAASRPTSSRRGPLHDDGPPEYTAFSDPSTRDTLRDTARHTRAVLPPVLQQLHRADDARRSSKHNLSNPFRLDPSSCPRLPQRARIHVVNDDTLNVAITHAFSSLPSSCAADFLPPAVVNFADRERPGGGWLNGAMAQEESLCYRTSLSLSLETSRRGGHYPLSAHEAEALYAPYVVVVRGDLASGHHLLLNTGPTGEVTDVRDLPVVSVLTVSAIRRPRVRRVGTLDGGQGDKFVFQRDRDRNLTKDKMRLVLRMAAMYGHRNLVLGALGCGVYANPPEDVACCWLEVMREDEFRGNWWRSVVFAVYDPKNEGNFEVFSRVLGGKLV